MQAFRRLASLMNAGGWSQRYCIEGCRVFRGVVVEVGVQEAAKRGL